jgi:hypothetical protein
MVSADLCSQPTISRLENLPDARALLRMGRAMVDHYCHHAGADIARMAVGLNRYAVVASPDLGSSNLFCSCLKYLTVVV